MSLGLLLPALLFFQAPEPAPKPVPKEGCVFCEIVAGTSPAKKVFENERVLAFWDIKPRAKFHLLVIPKQHVSSMKELSQLPTETKAALLDACTKVAQDFGFENEGFRVITNAGKDAHQTVFHLHFHVVGGEKLPEDAVRLRVSPKP